MTIKLNKYHIRSITSVNSNHDDIRGNNDRNINDNNDNDICNSDSSKLDNTSSNSSSDLPSMTMLHFD